jgi:hypothetical protein
MMIWKYELEVTDEQVVTLPAGARILALQVQHGQPCLWALVDPDAAKTPWKFRTVGTGHRVDFDTGSYVGTYQVRGGALVFHVFLLDVEPADSKP